MARRQHVAVAACLAVFLSGALYVAGGGAAAAARARRLLGQPGAAGAELTLAAKAPANSASPRIPRRVFQTARSAADVDADLSRRLETTSPGFERVFFDDAAAQEYMARAYAGTRILDAYEAAPRVVMRADLFRLAVVAREGGFYFDVDVYVKRSLEPLVAHAAVLPMEWWLSDDAFMERHHRNVLDAEEHWQVGNYAFGARPNHPLLIDALDEAAKRTLAAVGAPGDADVLRTTGPYMLSELYHAGRRAGKYADVVLLRGDAEPRVGRATRGGADWHKFGSFAEHLLAHTWVTEASRRLDETYDDETYDDETYDDEASGDQGSYSYEASGDQGSYSYEASGGQGSYSYETSSAGDQGSYSYSSSYGGVPNDSVLCPGLPAAAYCDCGGDCTGQPDWCACPEALECCGQSQAPYSYSYRPCPDEEDDFTDCLSSTPGFTADDDFFTDDDFDHSGHDHGRRLDDFSPETCDDVQQWLSNGQCANGPAACQAEYQAYVECTYEDLALSALGLACDFNCSSTGIWDGCDWVQSNSNTASEQYIGDAASPDECIAMVLAQCPDATIANLAVDGEGSCWCQYGEDPQPDSSGWMSCVLPLATMLVYEDENCAVEIGADGVACDWSAGLGNDDLGQQPYYYGTADDYHTNDGVYYGAADDYYTNDGVDYGAADDYYTNDGVYYGAADDYHNSRRLLQDDYHTNDGVYYGAADDYYTNDGVYYGAADDYHTNDGVYYGATDDYHTNDGVYYGAADDYYTNDGVYYGAADDYYTNDGGYTYWGTGNGWCSSDLDELIGSTSDASACWTMCENTYADLVAIDWTPDGECWCQDDCQCMEDTDNDDIHLITGSSIATLPNECVSACPAEEAAFQDCLSKQQSLDDDFFADGDDGDDGDDDDFSPNTCDDVQQHLSNGECEGPAVCQTEYQAWVECHYEDMAQSFLGLTCDLSCSGNLGSDAAQRTTAALGTLLGTTVLLLAL